MMTPSLLVARQPPRCELRFQSLFATGRSYVFPCDFCGRVDMDALSDRAREDYLYARAVVGAEFAHPAVMVGTE